MTSIEQSMLLQSKGEVRQDIGIPSAVEYPSLGQAWYATTVLLLVMSLSYLDRQVLSLLVLPIQADLHLSDTAMGMLLGPAFVFLYAVTGLPLGYLVDKYNRRNILAAGLTIWTIGTIACGLARSFDMLLIGRALVGMGEACVVPCTFSLVADCFPPHRRGRAVGVVSSGVSVGAGLALFGGGFLLNFASTIHHLNWPFLGVLKPWQLVFMSCGLPGLLVLGLLFTISEPNRHGGGRAKSLASGQQGLGTFLTRRAGTIATILFAYVLFTMIQYGLTSWTPAMFTRRLDLSPADAGFVLGALVITVNPAAALAGGFLGDWMSKRRPEGRLRMALLTAPFFIPGVILTCLGPNVEMVVLGIAITGFSGSMIGTSAYAAIQEMSPGEFRGRMLALYALAHGLGGMMLGAPAVAILTDHVFKDPQLVHLSMLAVSVPGALLAICLFWLGLGGFRAMRDAENSD